MLRSHLRYRLIVATRSRTVLLPVVAWILALMAAFADGTNTPASTWSLTSALSCALGAWLMSALIYSEPTAQANMATVAAGGRRRRTWLDFGVAVVISVLLTATFMAGPLLLGLLEPLPSTLGCVAAATTHICSSILGCSLGIGLSPPRVARRPTSLVGIGATLIVFVALSGPLGLFGGPISAARELQRAGAATYTLDEGVASLTCLALAICAALTSARVGGRDV